MEQHERRRWRRIGCPFPQGRKLRAARSDMAHAVLTLPAAPLRGYIKLFRVLLYKWQTS